jgi:uncharacterized membrane protein YphA (DoxX/SURF4 family)
MRRISIGHLLFGFAFAAEGALGLSARDFLLNQQPVAQGVPWREQLACISAAIMLLAGIGMLVPRSARLATLVLSGFTALWVLILHLPRAFAQPDNVGFWLGAGEVTTLATGGWLIYCALTAREDKTVSVARVLFGVALVPIGLSHIVYLKVAAEFIPPWFPFRVPLTFLTGVAHIAAGAAIAFGVLSRLAATLEAVMESGFTLVVWVSAVVAVPTDRQHWVDLFISTALTGAAWGLARSYRGKSWALARHRASAVSSAPLSLRDRATPH